MSTSQAHTHNKYAPHLHFRYDGDQYVTEVDADYVLWEVHGRKDFRYTATAGQVWLLDLKIVQSALNTQF